ncbi:DUF4270 domain-containing protein [Mucilaginibacter sp. UR6-1]|uniref:DUF4270 family protein n=1 Tax=Mucilaginibacter sp. UR6-1 TaxID=1435643 RepID=UPI001E41AAF4|nr:DUF4270 family protein [Mucilaginibacter sp. UR6-1]MCC8410560.1 DUF4270 domain-containing protein [Mucilaginibacter sp. UR6-1]
MRFFKLDLLTLLISLFILNSCKNPDGVGLDIDENNQISGTLVVDTNITLNTVAEDSVTVSDLGRSTLAYFNDAELGLTESALITDINLPGGTAYTKPTGTVTVDSAVLALKYSPTGFYGDSLTSTYKLDVYQLTDKPQGVTYYNSKKWQYGSTVLGTKTFLARPHDTIKITSVVDGGPDTAIRVVPQIRVRLNNPSLVGTWLNSTQAAASNLAFQNLVRGFYIKIDPAGTTGNGGIIALTSGDSLHVYTHVVDGTTTDTSVVSLPISRYINEIKHTYSDQVKAALANTTTSNQTAYLQGMGGLRVKVNFDKLTETLPKDIIINRAELVIVPKAGTLTPYAPLPKLTMYKSDLAKQRTYIEDMINGSANFSLLFGGYYAIPVKNEYRFLLTAYLQNLITGKVKDYGTYIAADNESLTSTSSAPNIGATAYPTARTVLLGKNSPYRVQLKIIYTRIK